MAEMGCHRSMLKLKVVLREMRIELVGPSKPAEGGLLT
jgi:hypothetical protein